MDDLIKALQILRKYGNPSYPTNCDHDELMISPDIAPDKVSDEDKAKLEKLGFDIKDIGCMQIFYSFKFGSA